MRFIKEESTKISGWVASAWISICLCAVLSCVFGVLSFFDFMSIKSFLDSVAPDGETELFSREIFVNARVMLRFYALCLLALAAFIYFQRNNFQNMQLPLRFLVWLESTRQHLIQLPTATKYLFAAIIISAVYLRLAAISLPIRSDEAWTYLNYIVQPVLWIIAEYTSPNNHILHTLSAKLSISLFGDSAFTMRLPALIAGLIAIPLAYRLFNRLAGEAVALLAATTCAVWPMLVDYSANARGYSMVVAGTLTLAILPTKFALMGVSYRLADLP